MGVKEKENNGQCKENQYVALPFFVTHFVRTGGEGRVVNIYTHS